MTEVRVSVVIPTKNEAEYLGATLSDLRGQTIPPYEIIVADAGSTDGTPAIAQERGCRVIAGGLPAEGRNRGAAQSSGEWILFVDADVRMGPETIELALEAVTRDRLDAASTWFMPDRGGWFLRLTHRLSNEWFRLVTRLGWPHSIGGFLFVRRSTHEAIGGFDESILVAEDQDYVVRIAKAGRYAFLRYPPVEISVRRFQNEGGWTMGIKWLRIEMHRLFRGEIRTDAYRYFKPGERDPSLAIDPPRTPGKPTGPPDDRDVTF